jgi:hypothetical protein
MSDLFKKITKGHAKPLPPSHRKYLSQLAKPHVNHREQAHATHEKKPKVNQMPVFHVADFMPKTPPGRETPKVESQDTGWVPCVKVKDNEYTGTKVLGIGTMHKSNACPIFSDDEAKDISSMRR